MAKASLTAQHASPPEHNLPVPLASLVGRARELERIGEALNKTRLVTLSGAGGVGKTRLALELARRQLARRPDGVWMVDLASGLDLPDPSAETARTLDVRSPGGGVTIDALRRYLMNRDLLLVLDNCEHVIGACAELATALLSSCANVRVMATSRESLGVNGETVWRLNPLGPEDAHRLFVERARQHQPGFLPGRNVEATIAQLCERLDRLPLAIELAAARVSVMSPMEILSSFDSRLGELGGSTRISPPHHRTLQAAVEWSQQLLDPTEKEAFRALAVFAGGFDADAATSVAPGLSLDVLARLVDKSLVTVMESPQGRTRYRLLETVREHARTMLVEANQLDAARARHLSYFAKLADASLEEWLSAGTQRLVNELDDDYENVRAALEWTVSSDPCAGIRMLGGTRDLFFRLGQADGLRLANELLERCPARDRYRAVGLIAAGQLAAMLGDQQTARQALEEADELSIELDEPALRAWSVFFRGLADTLAGAVESAREHLEASRDLHRALGVKVGEARSLTVMALTYLVANEPGRARSLYEEALAMSLDQDDTWGQGTCHTWLGLIAESAEANPASATVALSAGGRAVAAAERRDPPAGCTGRPGAGARCLRPSGRAANSVRRLGDSHAGWG